MEFEEKKDVYSILKKIVFKIENTQNDSEKRATLAKIRKTIGKELCEMKEIWSILFENLPEEFLGRNGKSSDEEMAIVTSLQIYAICGKGVAKVANDEETIGNIGRSLSKLRNITESSSVDQRFNAMITASSFEELIYHLKSLVNILKSKAEPNIDYALLAKDLYLFRRGFDREIKLEWARNYYRFSNVNKEEK